MGVHSHRFAGGNRGRTGIYTYEGKEATSFPPPALLGAHTSGFVVFCDRGDLICDDVNDSFTDRDHDELRNEPTGEPRTGINHPRDRPNHHRKQDTT